MGAAVGLTIAQRAELDEATVFERYAIAALIPARTDAVSTSSIDFRGRPGGGLVSMEGGATVRMVVSETICDGATIDVKDALRPLVFGAAWKIVDVMLEFALAAAGMTPPGKRSRWYITEKVSQARSGAVRLAPLTSRFPAGWLRLCLLYSGWEETRHSLVHRKAMVDPGTGALTGHDRSGNPLVPVTADEQEQFARLAADMCAVVVESRLTLRERKRMAWRLNQLTAHHGRPRLHAALRLTVAPNVIADVEQLSDGRLRVDVRGNLARAKAVFTEADAFTGMFHVPGADAHVYVCNLEEAPDEAIFAPGAPPEWLRVAPAR